MPDFVHKPTVVAAVRIPEDCWEGTGPERSARMRAVQDALYALGLVPDEERHYFRDGELKGFVLWAGTGEMLARPGDWIVRGVAGEFYPVSAEVFAEVYDPAP
jgi:hypothetical protein